MKYSKKHQQPKSSQSKESKQAKRQSHGTANQPKNDNSASGDKELIKTTPIPDTPFTVLKYHNDYYLTMGKYRLTKALPSQNACLKAATDASWNRILQVMQIMINENQNKPQAKTMPEMTAHNTESAETDDLKINQIAATENGRELK